MHNHFLELRTRLAECRTNLRAAKDHHEEVKTFAEQLEVTRGNITGKNAEERARQLYICLMDNGTYRQTLTDMRRAESEVERVEALLEAARDERRASEWQIRAQLAAAILGSDIPSDGGDPYGEDAFDNTLDAAIDRRALDPFDHAMHAG